MHTFGASFDTKTSGVEAQFGMNELLIGRRFNTELKDVPAIGDSLRDLQAAAAVGAQPILALTGKGNKTKQDGGLPAGTKIYADLAAAVQSLVT